MILAAISGLATALAFPKPHLFWLAWFSLVPLFISLKLTGQRQAWRPTLVFGLIFFGALLFSVNSLFRFAGYWVILGWLLLVLWQTIFAIIFAYGYVYLNNIYLAAVLWVGLEWLRSQGLFGLTAADLGQTQTSWLALLQISRLTTVYGLSFLIVLFNLAVAELFFNTQDKRPILLSGLLISLAVIFGWTQLLTPASLPDKTIKLALIQPNIDQVEKMSISEVEKVFNVHLQMTNYALAEKPRVVIWPETAIFSFVMQDNRYQAQIIELAKQNQVWLVIGAPYFDQGRAYNSIIVISPSGEVTGRYDKEKLVAFGEYLPFRRQLFPLLKNIGYFDDEFSSGARPANLEFGGLRAAPAICFESIFPGLIRERLRPDTDIILTLTNDAWFGTSSAAYLHANSGRLRAVENHKYFIQVGNSGISEVVDPQGRLVRQSRLNKRQILFVEMPGGRFDTNFRSTQRPIVARSSSNREAMYRDER